jgi:hypothetical protein
MARKSLGHSAALRRRALWRDLVLQDPADQLGPGHAEPAPDIQACDRQLLGQFDGNAQSRGCGAAAALSRTERAPYTWGPGPTRYDRTHFPLDML